MSGKKTEKLRDNSYIVPGILLMIIIIAILSSFGIRMVDEAKSRVEEYYQMETKEISKIYEKNFYNIEKVTNIIAAELLDKDDFFTDEVVENIKIVKDTLGVENIYVVNDGYSAIDVNRQTYANLLEDQKFKSIIESKVTMNTFIKGKDGKEYLYFMRPIASKMTTRGYVIIEYIPNVMETLLNNPKYSSRKTYGLVSSDGEVIESTGTKFHLLTHGENMIESAKDILYLDGSFNAFSQAVNDCRSGSQQIVYQEIGKNVYYTPVEGCNANIVMLVDTEDVERSFAAVSKTMRSMTLGIGITIIAFILIFLCMALFNRAKYNMETEDLQNKADTDLLTDLYNKVATERMIKEYLAGEGKDSVSMLFVLDVDDFKKINDTRGHAFGDQVLSSLGHQIRTWFRLNDILGRIGGDEFMIFVKDVKDPEVIRREGSRIMQFFEGFNVGEYSKYSPTASVGGAVYPNDGNDFESLYKAADKAVYKSKKEGKNRVSFYADLNRVEKDVVIDKKED
ncbi:MAG: GGDEF domain-containing protein [Lachnospiraceae bacterium]|nr:GGDEF domain-containing protein [Lachnospiraceae bacterium]